MELKQNKWDEHEPLKSEFKLIVDRTILLPKNIKTGYINKDQLD